MKIVLTFISLFMLGSVGGWVAELIYRNIKAAAQQKNKWVNPGFLAGPCLPIYGFGISLLCLFTLLSEKIEFTQNYWINGLISVVIMAVVMTLVELVAGEIFIIKMKVRLWDYRSMWGNYKGIICPLFSLIWGLVGAVYYFLVHPYLYWLVEYLINQNYMFFILGVFYGILAVDLVYSFQVVAKIKKFAEDNKIIVFYEDLKQNIVNSHKKQKEKASFTFVFKGNLQEYLKDYGERIKDSAENFKDKVQQNTENIKDKMQQNTENIKDKMQQNTENIKDKINSSKKK